MESPGVSYRAWTLTFSGPGDPAHQQPLTGKEAGELFFKHIAGAEGAASPYAPGTGTRKNSSETDAQHGPTMDYYKILEFKDEPFSNSPAPGIFFRSTLHRECLQRLEISLRLKRGLYVVLGEVGTGKTTLCRELIRKLAEDDAFEPHLILDPGFRSPEEFIVTIFELFKIDPISPVRDIPDLKEEIKQHIHGRGVTENRNIVLIIDEGQKLPGFCLELLREFLNDETNAHKLIQIVIFAQKEFKHLTAPHVNFTDRISLYHELTPLGFLDTRDLIRFRLARSATTDEGAHLFTLPAIFLIHRISGGYPRKIINLCHQALLTMIIQNRAKVDAFCVKTVKKRLFMNRPTTQKGRILLAFLFILVATSGGLFALRYPAGEKTSFPPSFSELLSMVRQNSAPTGQDRPAPATSMETDASGDKTVAPGREQGDRRSGVAPALFPASGEKSPDRTWDKENLPEKPSPDKAAKASGTPGALPEKSVESPGFNPAAPATISENSPTAPENTAVRNDSGDPAPFPPGHGDNAPAPSAMVAAEPNHGEQGPGEKAPPGKTAESPGSHGNETTAPEKNQLPMKRPGTTETGGETPTTPAPSGPVPIKRSLVTRPKAAYLKKNAAIPREQSVHGKATRPESFGKVRIEKNETLGRLIRVVYGEYTASLLHGVQNAGDGLYDVDHVQAGQSLIFPAAVLNYPKPPETCVWISLGETGNLGKAVDMVRKHPRRRYPVRLVPHWSPADGLKFTLVLLDYFNDKGSAEASRSSLPPEIRSRAVILESWPADTYFFTRQPRTDAEPGRVNGSLGTDQGAVTDSGPWSPQKARPHRNYLAINRPMHP